VCVACSQLEKLNLALLDIRQTHVTSEQHCGNETDQEETGGQKNTPSQLFRHLQEQLNNCVRHHQEIKR
jgi:signal transduction histidine kinase